MKDRRPDLVDRILGALLTLALVAAAILSIAVIAFLYFFGG